MGIGNLVGCMGMLLVMAGGVAWMIGGSGDGKRFLVAGIVLAAIGPAFGAWFGQVLRLFSLHETELAETLFIIFGVVLFVRFFGRDRAHERRVSLKRRVDNKE